jgi:hypothetical protein
LRFSGTVPPSRKRQEDFLVRRALIRSLLPLVFCTLPVLAAALIATSLPVDARNFYLFHLKTSPLDQLILAFGTALFVAQIFVAWRSLRWRGVSFDERFDPWLSNLAQAAEWFPLLGLIGTTAGIMQTFDSFRGKDQVAQAEVIAKYAPAITATCSGLLMALINILPTWIVLVGRDVIRTLGGGSSAPKVPAEASRI